MAVTVHHGDSREVLKGFDDASIDSVVCDPPYALVSIVKRFGKAAASDNTQTSERIRSRADGYARAASGFMGQQWDTGETAFDPAFWVEVMRVMKPGAHLIAFSGTRTYHRLACAIEDAGFEIRDMVSWLYGTGFPKSHDVAKGIDKALGCEREVIGFDQKKASQQSGKRRAEGYGLNGHDGAITIAGSGEAAQWQGWGTALKPACEPIVLARKPLAGTVAANVMAHGTGALNVDGCRIEASADDQEAMKRVVGFNKSYSNGEPGIALEGSADGSLHKRDRSEFDGAKGRWPANVVHDGSPEVLAGFPETPGQQGAVKGTESSNSFGGVTYSGPKARIGGYEPRADSGSAARFFYSAKADKGDRLGSKHPTVKPVDLMRWLCRLVTPPGGTVLDPFAGSGSTGMACLAEGFDAILIEREAQYVEDIKRRVAHVSGQDAPLFAQGAA